MDRTTSLPHSAAFAPKKKIMLFFSCQRRSHSPMEGQWLPVVPISPHHRQGKMKGKRKLNDRTVNPNARVVCQVGSRGRLQAAVVTFPSNPMGRFGSIDTRRPRYGPLGPGRLARVCQRTKSPTHPGHDKVLAALMRWAGNPSACCLLLGLLLFWNGGEVDCLASRPTSVMSGLFYISGRPGLELGRWQLLTTLLEDLCFLPCITRSLSQAATA